MYGLPQSVILAQTKLEKRLKAEGYSQSALIPRFWTHTTCTMCFMLCVENFGVKYVGKEHVQHLMAVLENHYTISHDWAGKRYLGIDLDWDYESRKVQLSMLLYFKEALI